MFIQPNFLWWGRLKSRMISGPHLPRADTRGHMFEFSGYSANSTPSGSYTPGYTPGYPGKFTTLLDTQASRNTKCTLRDT